MRVHMSGTEVLRTAARIFAVAASRFAHTRRLQSVAAAAAAVDAVQHARSIQRARVYTAAAAAVAVIAGAVIATAIAAASPTTPSASVHEKITTSHERTAFLYFVVNPH